MKARSLKIAPGEGTGFRPCDPAAATHIRLNMPGWVGGLVLPVILSGPRRGTGNWSWNGSIEAPTLRPSVLVTSGPDRCHSWIDGGRAQFLADTTHELAGQTVDLMDVE